MQPVMQTDESTTTKTTIVDCETPVAGPLAASTALASLESTELAMSR